jgi:hypothetical protein
MKQRHSHQCQGKENELYPHRAYRNPFPVSAAGEKKPGNKQE